MRSSAHVVRGGQRATPVRGSIVVALAAVLFGACLFGACAAGDQPTSVIVESSFADVVGANDERSTSRTSSGVSSIVFGRRIDGSVWRATRTKNSDAPVKLERLGAIGDSMSSTVREQAGLLGVAELGDEVFASWTDSAGLLRVTELRTSRVVWQGTATANKAIGGHLGVRDDHLVLGLGELTAWAKQHGSGALVTLDPGGPPSQVPSVLSDGWHNPFAFTVDRDGVIWVADNAPDGGVERIGRGDVAGQASNAISLPKPQRAPSAIAALPDGRLVVCGFLDRELRRYETVPSDSNEVTIERSGTITGTCATAVASFDDGSLLVGDTDGLRWVR